MTPSPSSSAFGGQASNDLARQDRLISGGFASEQAVNRGVMHVLSELTPEILAEIERLKGEAG